jgi:predicted ATPase/DNA-binding XRE family transcriptional regulator
MGSGEPGRFGELLKQMRSAARLTQEELADRAALSVRAVQDLERGRRRSPHAGTARRLAEALGLSAADRNTFLACVGTHSAPAAGSTQPERGSELPAALSSFVGRHREMVELQRLLGSTRLLTLTGPGGVGKTRLALELARVAEERTPAVFVDLAPLNDPTLVVSAVAASVSVREQPGRSLQDTLAASLRQRQLLLLLDNCEHLVQPCADIAAALLRACPDLTILATSREPLGITGETAWPVFPLGLPERDAAPEQLAEVEGVRLFLERARSVLPSFALTHRNAPAVAEVCRRLDGLPLAIELAAARVRTLGVEQMAARLDDRFRLLRDGSRTAPVRHQTLRAAIEWSHGLLSEPERRLFARLAVFAGGWDLEAAEAVCAGKDLDARAVLDLLARLVDQSLVVVADTADYRRYRLLETIREYAWERLRESDEEHALRGQHLAFYTRFAEDNRLVDTPDELRRLNIELDNFRAALGWVAPPDALEVQLRLAGSLWWLWRTRGHVSEGRRRLEQLLAAAAAMPVTSARADAVGAAAALARIGGDTERAAALLDEVLSLGDGLDRETTARLLEHRADVAADQSDYARAMDLLGRSHQVYRELGDEGDAVRTLGYIGELARRQGDGSRAAALLQQCLDLSRERGFNFGITYSLNVLGLLARQQGELDRAERLYAESLAGYRAAAVVPGVSAVLVNLAVVARERGQPARALELLGESLALKQQADDRSGGLARLVEVLAGTLGDQGQAEQAARLFGAAEALRQEIGAPVPPDERPEYERDVSHLRRWLEAAAFARAWAEGRGTPLERVIGQALALPAVSRTRL